MLNPRTATIADRPLVAGPPLEQAQAAANWASVSLADLAPGLGLTVAADPRFAEITFSVRRLKAGETLYRAGDRFDAIYAVRSGFFKTVCVEPAGSEVVLAFPMGGDLVGLDGLDPGRYTADVVALDTCHVAVLPFARLVQLGREHPAIERLLYALFSRELVRDHGMIRLLGTLNAEARVAAFLLDLSERFGHLGYSRASFALRMTRQELGSYLGIKLETVSRTLSAFAVAGLIAVDRRMLILRDLAGLRRIVEPRDEGSRRPARNAGRATVPCTPAQSRVAAFSQAAPALV
jgi:CRP/FNR family transcriptional regulator, anaerobic regulatory protein